MNIICGIVLLTNLIIITNGYVARERLTPNPDYPGKCYSKITKQAYSPGEFFFAYDKCEKYTCYIESESPNLLFAIHGCGSIAPPENCTLTKHDYTKSYPECCPKPDC